MFPLLNKETAAVLAELLAAGESGGTSRTIATALELDFRSVGSRLRLWHSAGVLGRKGIDTHPAKVYFVLEEHRDRLAREIRLSPWGSPLG